MNDKDILFDESQKKRIELENQEQDISKQIKELENLYSEQAREQGRTKNVYEEIMGTGKPDEFYGHIERCFEEIRNCDTKIYEQMEQICEDKKKERRAIRCQLED